MDSLSARRCTLTSRVRTRGAYLDTDTAAQVPNIVIWAMGAGWFHLINSLTKRSTSGPFPADPGFPGIPTHILRTMS